MDSVSLSISLSLFALCSKSSVDGTPPESPPNSPVAGPHLWKISNHGLLLKVWKDSLIYFGSEILAPTSLSSPQVVSMPSLAVILVFPLSSCLETCRVNEIGLCGVAAGLVCKLDSL